MDPSVYQPLLDALAAQVPTTGFRLDGIEVEVGVLLELDTTELQAALQAALPGVQVRIVPVVAVLHCDDCGAEYPSDEHPCPVCGSLRAHLVRGEELGIVRAWGETV